MKHFWKSVISCLLCAAMLMVPVSGAETTTASAENAPMLAYVPLDNRPVVYQRVQMAAGASGFDIRVPDEELFMTKLDGQGGTGINGSQHGDGSAIMDWLEEMENSGCDTYIIHLDQMFSGGLVGSRHPDSETVTQEELDIMDRLLAISNDPSNKVYYIDIVMRLASTGSYKGYESAQYSALREWGALDRLVMDTKPFFTTDYNTSVAQLDAIASNYRKGANGSTLAYNTSALTEANVKEYLAFRKRKMTLMNLMIQYMNPGTTYLVGVDDSSPNKNIQWNELMFLDARADVMGLDYVRMSDTDSIGLMAVARCINDRFGVRPKVQVRYYGNKADATDDYGNDTLRKNVDTHIECLNAISVSSGADVEVLVLTQPDSSYTDQSYKDNIDALISKANSNIQSHIPTIVIEVSEQYIDAWGNGSKNLQDELLNKVEIGRLMGYSNWNTVGNSIGIALGMGVARYTYLDYAESITEQSHIWQLQSLAYAFVKDISYNARNKINYWHHYAANSFHVWLINTQGWYDNNFFLDKTAGTVNNMDSYDGRSDGDVTAGRAFVNKALEAFMRGKASNYVGSGYTAPTATADYIVNKLLDDQMYTNFNRTVQTADIDSITLSNFYFPWDRHFEIYFDVDATVGEEHTYYSNQKNWTDADGGKENVLWRVPVAQTAQTFMSHATQQYGTVTLTDPNGNTPDGAALVGTGYKVVISGVTYVAIVKADIDGDAKINSRDVREVMKHILGQTELSTAEQAAANVHTDNAQINSSDARQILQLVLRQ